MKKITVSVGIPAYNEASNIRSLLTCVLNQKIEDITLKEIIVVSDGSTDATVTEVKKVKDKRIKLYKRSKRIGMNQTENEIISYASGDILLFMNADVLPCDDRLIHTMIQPILKDKRVGIVGGNTVAASPARTLVDWILSSGHEMKQNLYARINKGQNVYLCHGRIRALKKEVYQNLLFPSVVPEDAYSYFHALSQGYTFQFERHARVFFRSPITLAEHGKQSQRFESGKKILQEFFDKTYVEKAYEIPLSILLRGFIWYFLRHPLSMVSYLCLNLCTKLFFSKKSNPVLWEVATSSKSVV